MKLLGGGGVAVLAGVVGRRPAGAEEPVPCIDVRDCMRFVAQCTSRIQCVGGFCAVEYAAGTCDPATGQCSAPTFAPPGTQCFDADVDPLCAAGPTGSGACCTDAGRVVIHGGCFQTCTTTQDCRCGECIPGIDGSGGNSL